MKYIEEIKPGDCFEYKNQKYILTSDSRNNKGQEESKAVSMQNGFTRWLNTGLSVHRVELYLIDDDKNIIPIKEYQDEFTENKNIH